MENKRKVVEGSKDRARKSILKKSWVTARDPKPAEEISLIRIWRGYRRCFVLRYLPIDPYVPAFTPAVCSYFIFYLCFIYHRGVPNKEARYAGPFANFGYIKGRKGALGLPGYD